MMQAEYACLVFSPCFTTGLSFLFVYFGKVLLWIAFGVFMVNFVESKEHAFVSHWLIFVFLMFCVCVNGCQVHYCTRLGNLHFIQMLLKLNTTITLTRGENNFYCFQGIFTDFYFCLCYEYL